LGVICFSLDVQERERKEEEERIRTENLLRGNPLLNQQQNSSFKVKRRSGGTLNFWTRQTVSFPVDALSSQMG